ncbi:hypothetical protein BDZ89DRAFT_1133488 [Hymenopellis radicata]|nr:hypothetical protein BDZ89DRAFT_1133488 [Hymenopellis radicata]
MPSFAQTLPVVLLVAASAFAAPAYIPGESDVLSNKADPQNPTEALSAFKRNKIACSNDMYSDKCDMELVRRHNILELALSKRHSVSKAIAPVESDDAHAEHVGKNATPASASPSAAHVSGSGCSPNFEGAGLRVVDSFSSLEFGPSAANALAPVISSSFRGPNVVDWHFEQTGQLDGVYIIKDIDNNNLAAYALADRNIILDTVSDSDNAPDQIWTVRCDTCSTGISGIDGKVASQCIIRSPARNGGCVAVGPNPDSLAHVTNSRACTKFDFFTN